MKPIATLTLCAKMCAKMCAKTPMLLFVVALGGCSLLLDEAPNDAGVPALDATVIDSRGEADAETGPAIEMISEVVQPSGIKTYQVTLGQYETVLLLLATASGATSPVVTQDDSLVVPIVEHVNGQLPNMRRVAIFELQQSDLTIDVPIMAVASVALVGILGVPNPVFLEPKMGGGNLGCTVAKTIDFDSLGLLLGLITIPSGASTVGLRPAGTSMALYERSGGNISALGLWDLSTDVLKYDCDTGTPAHVGIRIIAGNP